MKFDKLTLALIVGAGTYFLMSQEIKRLKDRLQEHEQQAIVSGYGSKYYLNGA